MVNKVVLEYLRMHRGNYKIDDLKKKVLASGYTRQDVDGAMVQLNKESSGAVPSVGATINKINKTNVDMNVNKPVAPVQPVVSNVAQKPKKKKSGWLKWFIIIWVVLLVLAGIGFGLWFWLSG